MERDPDATPSDETTQEGVPQPAGDPAESGPVAPGGGEAELDPSLVAHIEDALGSIEDEEDEEPVGEPLCEHEWSDLVFLVDEEGLACRQCGETWPLGDDDTSQAVQLVWNSSRLAMADLNGRLGALEGLVRRRMQAAPCEACRRFVDTSDPTDGLEIVSGHWCCSEHVPLVLGLRRGSEEALHRVSAWAMAQDLVHTKDPRRRWRWEQLVSVAPDLAEVAGERDEWAITHRVTLHPQLAEALRLDQEASLQEIANAVAAHVDVEAPSSRTGVGFLAGIVAAAEDVLLGKHESDPELYDLPGNERIWTEVHNRVILPSSEARSRLILDLFSDLGVDGNPDGLGGDILSMLTHRIAEELLTPLLEDDEQPEAGEG